MYDSIVIHYYPGVECIAKCAVNMKTGKKIAMRFCIRDLPAAYSWIQRHGYSSLPYRVIVHWN